MRHHQTIIRTLYTALLSVVLMLVACGPDEFLDRRELYATEARVPKVRLDVDWMSRVGKKPTGMTVMMRGTDGTGGMNTSTNEVDSMVLRLDANSYRTLVYNLSPDEFGSMDFHDENDFDSIHVTLTPIQMRSADGWDRDYVYAREPEDIAVALDTITITREMVDEYSAIVRQRFANGMKGDKVDTTLYVFRETPVPIITTLNVIVRVLGIQNAMSVEGNITDMADGVYLSAGHSTPTTCTHQLSSWNMYTDSTGSRNGYITTSIRTFGLPHGTENVVGRDSTLNYLNLYFKLRDDSTIVQYHYAVGDLFKYGIERNGVHEYTTRVTLELDLIIDADTHPDVPDIPPDLPDVEDRTKTGFDATVEDWDEQSKDVYL